MKKSTRLFKQYLATFLVVLMSIESFAAVVGDNDGAAFITKAEFDSMKNDFQSQLDRYNSSIDNKIDGAIASYLAGVSIGKESILEPIITNYAEMKFKRGWDIYGWYRQFHNKLLTNDISDTWYLPHVQDFIALRRTNYQVTMTKLRDSGGSVTTIWGDWQTDVGRWSAYDNSKVFQKFAIMCDATTNDEIRLGEFEAWRAGPDYVDDKITHFSLQTLLAAYGNSGGRSYGQMEAEDYPLKWDAATNTWLSSYAGKTPTSHSRAISPLLATDSRCPFIEDLGAVGDDVLHWRVAFNHNNERSNIYSNVFELTPNHIAPLQIWTINGLETVDKSQFTDALMNSSTITFSDHFWDEDLYVDGLDEITAADQANDLRHLMLGKDFDWVAPILRIDITKPVAGYYAVNTKYARFDVLKLNANTVRLGASVPWTFDEVFQRTYNPSIQMDWRVPTLEKYDFKKITSGLFKYDNTNLKFGQGLPISRALNTDGNLHIEFDYSLGRTVGTVPTTATGIEIDLKDSDFLTNSNTFYTGYLNDNTSSVSIHNLEVDNSTNHVKLTIEGVKKDKGVWLRIAPKSTESGLYAQMNNLKVKLISE